MGLHFYESKSDSYNRNVGCAICSCTHAPHPFDTHIRHVAQRVVSCCVPRPTRDMCTALSVQKLFSNRVCHAAFPCSPPSSRAPPFRVVLCSGPVFVRQLRLPSSSVRALDATHACCLFLCSAANVTPRAPLVLYLLRLLSHHVLNNQNGKALFSLLSLPSLSLLSLVALMSSP